MDNRALHLKIISTLKNNKDQVVLAVIFVASIILKFKLLVGFQGPFILQDEFEFKENAYFIFSKFEYFYYYITPLYSIYLIPSFIFEDFYYYMKVANILVTSSVLFPVYGISLLVCGSKKKIYPTIISVMLPFNFLFPSLIMSENLFIFLFICTVYLLLRTIEEDNLILDILFGLFLGLSFLTRYFAIILIPIMLSLWWLRLFSKPKQESLVTNIRKNIIRFFGITILNIAIVMSWTYYSIDTIAHVAKDYFNPFIMGNAQEIKINRFVNLSVWILRYSLYAIFLFAPFISEIFYFIFSEKFNLRDRSIRYLFLIIVISFGFLALASWHMRETYYIDASLRGRYIIYISILWIIYAYRKESIEHKNTISKLVSFFVSLAILCLAYALLIRGYFFQFDKLSFFQSFNVPELYLINNGGIFVFLIFILSNLSIFAGPSVKSLFLFIMAMSYYAFGAIKLPQSLQDFINKTYTTNLYLFKNHSNVGKKLILYNNNSEMISPYFRERYFRFFNIDPNKFEIYSIDDYEMIEKPGYLVSDQIVSGKKPIEYINDRYIYKVPFEESKFKTYFDFHEMFEQGIKKNNIIVEAPWKQSIAKLTNKTIFLMPESSIEYRLKLPNLKETRLNAYLSFHPFAKNWNISDGAVFSVDVVANDKLETIGNFNCKPLKDPEEIIISLKKWKGKNISIIFRATNHPGNNQDGDWLVLTRANISQN